MQLRLIAAALGVVLFLNPALATSVYPFPPKAERGLVGIASYYGNHRDGFAGRRTACGQIMQPQAFTAAHRTLPCGTRVLVIAPEKNGGRSVVVTINDRGPFVRGRIIDVSPAAARVLGIIKAGTAKVMLRVIK